MTNIRARRGDPLTARERRVLQLASYGRTNAEIAAAEHVSRETVKDDNQRIYVKLGVPNIAAAVGVAFRRGIIS